MKEGKLLMDIDLHLNLKQEKKKANGKDREKADLFKERLFRVEKKGTQTEVYDHLGSVVKVLNIIDTDKIFRTKRTTYPAVYDYETGILTIVKYISLHGHSCYSILDCISRPEDIAKKAELSIAVTDHGNMFGALKFYKAMKGEGKKPILGFEAYTSSLDYIYETKDGDTLHSILKENHVSVERLLKANNNKIVLETFEGEPIEGDANIPLIEKLSQPEMIMVKGGQELIIHQSNAKNHLVLLAENEVGYKNLVKLTSIGQQKYTRGRPQIDWDDLRQYHEGVVALSACLAGELPRAILNGKMDQARKIIREMIKIFGKDNYYLEIQRHGIDEERVLNPTLMALAEEFGLKVVATADNHFTNKEDYIAHEAHLCIGTKSLLTDPNHWTFPGKGYHIHSSAEMEELFADIPEVLDNTLELADRLNGEIPTGKIYMPHFPIPTVYKDETAYFETLVKKGFEDRFKGRPEYNDPQYQERLQFEIDTIKNMKFPGYFLIVADYVNYAKRNYHLVDEETAKRWKKFIKERGYDPRPIAVGPGRGSACGSLVAYCMNITNVDPIPYGLLFERFLNPDRVSMPDVDMDFPDSRREEVLEYVRDLYGSDSVSGIVTFGTMAAKSVVRDVARVMGFPPAFGDMIAKLIPDKIEVSGKKLKITLKNCIEHDLGFAQLYNSEDDVKKVVDLGMRLEGLPRNTSQHACFDAETLVTTSKGLKRIVDVEIGDKVLTHMGRYKEVVRLMETETEEVYNLKTNASFPIEVTGNHPMFVREMSNNNKHKVRKLGEPKWKTVENLTVNQDYIGIPVNRESVVPSYENINLPFDNKSFWWIIGRYIGDGWTEHPHSKQGNAEFYNKYVIVCCSKKTGEEKEQIISKLHEAGFGYWVEESNTTYKIHIKECNDLFDYLQTFGKYAHGKHLNEDILRLPKELLLAFFEGYMSADGRHIKEKDLYSFKTVSKKLAIGMMQVVNKVYERPARVYILPEKDEYIQGRLVHAKEKYDIKFYKKARKNREKSFYEDGYIWTRVSYLEKETKSKSMYNLTVLDDSSYVAQGLAAHNCGYLISADPVTDHIPQATVYNKETKLRDTVTQFEGPECEEAGILKMDFLGLRTMGVIDRTVNRANEKRAKNGQELLNMDNLSEKAINDLNIYKFISQGNTAGVFQLESAGMTDLMKQLYQDVGQMDEKDPTVAKELFERLVAGISLYRPGPMDEIPNYVKNMLDPKGIVYDTPELKEILSATYNVIVYQEQVMFIVRELAGFTRGQSDTIRKAMGKKKVEIINQYEDYFLYGNEEIGIKGCKQLGINMDLAKDIWERMKKFALYAFNKSHAVGYADIAIMNAYLACYYPVETMCEILNSYKKKADRIKQFIGVCKARGIKVLSPDVNTSETDFGVEGDGIRFGFNGLKNMGKSGLLIIEERKQRGKFKSLFDFVQRMAIHQRINKRMMESLIYSGTLDGFWGTRKEKLNMLDILLGIASATKELSKERMVPLFNALAFQPTKELLITSKPLGEIDFQTKLLKEKEYTGFYVTGHPIDQYTPILSRMNISGLNKINTFIEVEDETLISEGEEVQKKRKDVETRLVGAVQEIEVFITRKGEQMASFEIEDETGVIKAVMFPQAYILYSHLLKEGAVLSFGGQVSYGERGTQFKTQLVETIEELSASTDPQYIQLTLSDDMKSAQLELNEIDRLLYDSHRNGIKNHIPIVFVINNKKFIKRKGQTIYGNISGDTIQGLQMLLGQKNVFVAY